jgi:hypothetical protein
MGGKFKFLTSAKGSDLGTFCWQWDQNQTTFRD